MKTEKIDLWRSSNFYHELHPPVCSENSAQSNESIPNQFPDSVSFLYPLMIIIDIPDDEMVCCGGR